MMLESWAIIPFEQFGPFRFGMTREETREILGAGCKAVREQHTPGLRGLLEVNTAESVRCYFDDADTLRFVEVSAPQTAMYAGVILPGTTIDDARDVLSTMGDAPTETFDGWGFERLGVTLRPSADGRVAAIGAGSRAEFERLHTVWKKDAARRAKGPPVDLEKMRALFGKKTEPAHEPTPTRRYEVHLSSLYEHFPPGVTPSTLLVEFAQWVATKPDDSLGEFRVEALRWTDAQSGADLGDLYPCFALFFHLHEGSLVAFWFPEGEPMESPPVVFIGSEGELALLAHSLEQFLAQLAHADTGVSYLDKKRSFDDRAALKNWLKARDIPARVVPASIPNFVAWWNTRQAAQEAFRNQDPIRLEIAEKLRQFAPPPADAPRYWRERFDVLLVGSRFQMWHRHGAIIPLPSELTAELEPLVRKDRERRAREMPQRGLWFTAWLTITRSGGARLDCDYYELPRIFDTTPDISIEDYRADLTAFPRTPFWMPDWLKLKLAR